MIKNDSAMLLLQNGQSEVLKGENTCTYIF